MTAPSQRGLAPLTGLAQWLRCGHADTAVDLDDEVVTLAWQPREEGVTWGGGAGPESAGLAFAANGCLYHGIPERAQIERVAWPAEQSGVDLLAPAPAHGDDSAGHFQPAAPAPGRTVRAVALAADSDEHLFMLDGPTGLIHVLDLVDGHLLRTVALPWTPVDLASMDDTVLIATDDLAHPLVSITALGTPAAVALPAGTFTGLPGGARPRRVAAGWADGGRVRWLLVGDGVTAFAVAVDPGWGAGPVTLPGATDIEVDGRGALVVAGPPGADLRRFVATAEATGEEAPLRARGYDGRGLVRTPDGRVGFWTDRGFRCTVPARRRFTTTGHVDAFALDSAAYRTQWGRVFVEACVPPGARIQIGFATSDDGPAAEEPVGPSIAPRAPQLITIRPGEGGPPSTAGALPLVPSGLQPVVAQRRPMHRREVGPDRPWARRAPGDRFEVYEAPVQAPPGRYLWLRITLEGDTRVTPRLRAVRVELTGHDLLERLPRLYRRDEQAASFLRRYLALADGLLSEIEARAVQRDLVLDPFGAPPELLPWLASLVGLALDDRWSQRARRTMLSEAICLFRWRGTVTGLRRMMQIYLETDVVIVEAFRFRGTGGAFVDGESRPVSGSAVVGHGLRVGGEVGEATTQPLTATTADAYRTHAHRFSVIVPRDLDDEQLQTVAHLLDLHRPAHTRVDVCHAGRGMRIGIGLHLELSSVVGPSARFSPSVVGASRVGPPTVLGRARPGVRAGGARLGRDTVVDP